MKCVALLIFFWLLPFGEPAWAQSNSSAGTATQVGTASAVAAEPSDSGSPIAVSSSTGGDAGDPGTPDATPAAGEPPAQKPLKVFEDYNVQVYAGYTYMRFHEGGEFAPNLNGFDAGEMYYPLGGSLGLNGEFTLGLGTQNKTQAARFLLGLGGPSFRWAAPRESQIWAHVLAGYSHFLPQTSFGGQSAFGYELGGGFDTKAWNPRFAYRVQADLIGTRYFGKSQFSPKISIGLVWMF
jgi:hypothetical protein